MKQLVIIGAIIGGGLFAAHRANLLMSAEDAKASVCAREGLKSTALCAGDNDWQDWWDRSRPADPKPGNPWHQPEGGDNYLELM